MCKKLCVLCVLCVIGMGYCLCSAEESGAVELTEEQKGLVRQRVVQKVDEFVDALTRMVDNSQTHAVRVENQKNLLNLFIGRGDAYDYEDVGVGMVHSDGVQMWTSSVTRGTSTPQLLRGYIRRLYNPAKRRSEMSYSQIKIKKAAAVRVDNIQKEGDHYVCVAHFYQDFYGIRDGRVVYSDRTGKQIKCYITPIELPDAGVVFDAKLGDITVTETQKIPISR